VEFHPPYLVLDLFHSVKHLPAFGVPIRARGRATPSHPSIITDVEVE
jgi:hypothetical protein